MKTALLPGLLVLAAASAAPAHAGAVLAGHRAVYDLALGEASDRSGITALTGRMVYEFNGSPCEGYTVTFRFVTKIETDETTRLTDQQSATFEEGDGKGFRFVTKSYVNSALDKELDGKAELTAKETNVRITKPAGDEIELPVTQFPTQHLLELLQRAESGETFYETTLFDGSDNADQVMTTTVIIGKKSEPKADDPELGPLGAASKQAYWPVTIAYFEPESEKGQEVPIYRIAFKLHENGVTRDLTMDYGDFSMKGKLVNFDAFKPAGDCKAK
ncbi:MAG: cell envelope integrity EipB family protein [Rhizobiaceae bacterium]